MRLTDPSLLHPAFRDKLRGLEAKLSNEGLPLKLYEGARTPFRQAELYARGRTIPHTTKVTHAEAWTSYHNYGLAADYVFYLGGSWTWSEPQLGMWQRYTQIARGEGLECLDFERPHVQLSYPLTHLRRGVYPTGGDATWEAWLSAQIEAWGTFRREHGGIMHPGSPPLIDGDMRPELVA